MNRERLIQLYEMMDGIPADQVSMSSWVSKVPFNQRTFPLDTNSDALVASHGCGAIACALGFAAQYPPFVDAGLSIDEVDVRLGPRFKNLRGYSAGAVFFDLSLDQADDLFRPVQISARAGGKDKAVFLKRLKTLLYQDPQPAI